ncbi:mCG144530, partial [Mus musculus]
WSNREYYTPLIHLEGAVSCPCTVGTLAFNSHGLKGVMKLFEEKCIVHIFSPKFPYIFAVNKEILVSFNLMTGWGLVSASGLCASSLLA